MQPVSHLRSLFTNWCCMFSNALVKLASCALCSFFLAPGYCASTGSLAGTWKEVDDEQTTSVLRFQQSGAEWTGKYIQVSTQQARYGFLVGEEIIRGRLQGTRFTGQVLLKNIDANPACPEVGIGWVPVKMDLVSDGRRLQGSFRGTLVDERTECRVSGHDWQSYKLQLVK